MKYYVTSDVHGFYTPLREALTNAGYFDDDVPHKLLIAGDLFDRGGEATALQDFILDLMDRDAVILIRGNHEDLYEELVPWKKRWRRSTCTHGTTISTGCVSTVR